MVGAFLFPFWFWITLIPLALLGLCLLLAYLARFRSPATVDVCHFLRGADAKRMFSALLVDALLGGRSATPHFLETSRLRLHEARKSLFTIFHDMGVLIAWSRGALHMELVQKPWEDEGGEEDKDSEKFVAGHRALIAAAREFRRYALISLVRVNLALLFHAHWRLRRFVPSWTTLGEGCNRGFLAVYGKAFQAVAEVTALYDEGLAEEFLKALFKLEDPEAAIAAWKTAGLLLGSLPG